MLPYMESTNKGIPNVVVDQALECVVQIAPSGNFPAPSVKNDSAAYKSFADGHRRKYPSDFHANSWHNHSICFADGPRRKFPSDSRPTLLTTIKI